MSQTVWGIHMPDHAGIDALSNSLVSIGWPEMDDLTRLPSDREAIKDSLARTYPHKKAGAIPGNAGVIYRFVHEVAEGDTGGLPEPVPASNASPSTPGAPVESQSAEPELKEQHIVVMENQRGLSYEELFGPYLKGATHITITDPYIRLFYQARNLTGFLETVVRQKAASDEVQVNLVTVDDEFKGEQQRVWFDQIQSSMLTVIKFAFSFDGSGTQHSRHIVTDTGWKIALDRGLDIFQQYEINDAFQLTNRVQSQRPCKAFEVTYLRVGD